MNRDHRRIIHDLAQVYGLESVSYDSEPKRNVVVTAVRWVDLAVTGGALQQGRHDAHSLCVPLLLPPPPGGTEGKYISPEQSFTIA